MLLGEFCLSFLENGHDIAENEPYEVTKIEGVLNGSVSGHAIGHDGVCQKR